jgi:hypothetical protein
MARVDREAQALAKDLTVNGWNTGLAGVIREYISRQRELVIRDDRLD